MQLNLKLMLDYQTDDWVEINFLNIGISNNHDQSI